MASKLSLGQSGSMTITGPAESFMRRMIRLAGQGPSAGFRLVVTPGGCSGLSSDFSIEPAAKAADATLTLGGMTLFVPTACLDLLASVIIDFVDSPTQTGLSFFDPKVASCATESHAAELVQLDKPGP